VAKVEFDEVGKIYSDGTRAVEALSLAVTDGEFLVLVGPSGCGKTTALRMAAGLEDISEGTIRIGDRVVNNVPARDRDVAMVFQSYALYPHLDVFDNIAFGLRLRKVPTPEITRRVNTAANALGLSDYLHRRPRALSGGQRQRVAMGRAIVREPQVFFMDEPLSNLDAKLRVQTRAEIARNSRRLGVTTIYVTHDQTEAMTLGHRVAVMKRGLLQQVAAPQELYDSPANLFVAGFIGSPAMNLLRGVFTVDDEPTVMSADSAVQSTSSVILGDQRLRVGPEVIAARPALRAYRNQAVAVGIRPEELAETTPDQPPLTTLTVTVELTEALGSDLLVHGGINAEPVETEDTKELARDAGTEESPTNSSFPSTLVGRFSPRARVREGDRIQVAVDINQLHLFDLDTGRAIR
jgi:multiple sugar transport system ATP-binding protein